MCSPQPNDPPTVTCKIPKLEDINPPSCPWEDAPIPTEVVLLTVKDPEFLGCYAFLKNIKKSLGDGLGWVYFGELVKADGNTQKVNVSLVKCYEGTSDPGGASTTVQNAVRILKPKAVMCVGYCGGLNLRKVKLGDVVLSAKLAMYSNSKITSSGVEVRATITNVSRRMKNLILSAGHGWKAPIVNNETDQLGKPEVHCMAEIASGPELVNADERREELLRLFPAAIAIEMEGEGVYATCDDLGVEWAVIKGVSDYADDARSETENWKPFAAAMAASVVNHMFNDPVVVSTWPHYSETTSTANQKLCYIAALGEYSAPTLPVSPPPPNPAVPISADNGGGSTRAQDDAYLRNLGLGDSGQIIFKGRPICYSSQSRLSLSGWIYDGEAVDKTTGIKVTKGGFRRSGDANKYAVIGLVQKLREVGILND